MKQIPFIPVSLLLIFIAGYFILSNYFSTPTSEATVTYRSNIVTYVEDETVATAQFSRDGDFIKLSVNGAQQVLKHSISASGARYTNEDESVVFWKHQDTAFIEINGVTVMEGGVPAEEKDIATNTSPLANTTWQWKQTTYTNKTITPTTPDDFVITFMTEGQFSATTDCNTIVGTYTISGDNLGFSNLASTRMACLQETQEEVFAAMLSEATHYDMTDEGLLGMRLTDGTMFFTPSEKTKRPPSKQN